MSTAPSSPAQRGFTLMEVLVVMVLVGLISVTLIQMLSFVFVLQGRTSSVVLASQEGAMLADWVQQVARGMQPDYQDGRHRFHGDARGFSGLTTNPLSSGYGAITPVELRIVYDSSRQRSGLQYVSGHTSSELFGWNGDYGRFAYVDSKGQEHDSWPPPLGAWPQRPTLIELQARRGDENWLIVAVPQGAPEPPRIVKSPF